MENNQPAKKVRKKGTIPLLLSAIIAIAYLVYALKHFVGGTVNAQETGEVLASLVASALVSPHLICTGVATLMNLFALFFKRHGFALTAGILFIIAMVLFPMYFMFVLLEAILCFIGYARMKDSIGK